MEYKYNKEDIQQTLATLRAGGVILYPTDTIWGLGCDATNEEAVQKIFKLKQREDAKSMLLLVDAPERIPNYVEDVPDLAWNLMEIAIKPLSIIYDQAKRLPKAVVANDGSVGIRVCEEPFVKELLQQFRKPIISTSANVSGKFTPAIFDEIDDEIKLAVDYVVRYRQEDVNKAASSSIIKLGKYGQLQLIRE